MKKILSKIKYNATASYIQNMHSNRAYETEDGNKHLM